MSNTIKKSPLLSIQDVGKIYQTPAGDYQVLSDVNIDIKAGHFTVLCGSSGSGKSTLLHLAAGLDAPSTGNILFRGSIIPKKPAAAAQWRAQHVGIVFQFFQLLPTLRAVENVMLPMEFVHCSDMQKIKKDTRNLRTRAMELLEMVGIADYAEKLPSQLSGGEQQRVAIARSLANDPAILLADEPTGNLDSENSKIVLDLLLSVVKTGTSVLMVTHDDKATLCADQIFHLKDGSLI